jgi:hypothetical protein
MTEADDERAGDAPARWNWALFAALAGIGLVGSALSLVLTRHTPGLAPPDSMVYLAVADSLRAGHGYSAPFNTLFDAVSPAVASRGHVPLAHWGPGYPTLLAAGNLVFGTSIRAARFVNAGLFATSVVLGGLIVYRIRPSYVRALGAAVVLALLPAMIWVHGFVFADAMLLTATLATVLALHSLVVRPTPWRYALVSLFAFVATSSKYSGVAAAVAAGGTVALVMSGSIGRRLLRAAVVAAPSLVFGALWLQRGDARGLESHLPDHVDLSTIAGTFGGWFGSGHATTMRHVALAAVVLLVVAAIWTAIGRGLPPECRALTVSLGLVGFLVFAIVLFSRSFVDALVSFGHRQFLPVEIVVVLLVAAFKVPSGSHEWLRVSTYGAIVAAALFAIWPFSPRGHWVFGVPGQLTTVGALRHGFPAVEDDHASRIVASLPRGAVIASDFPENVWLHTGRGAIQIPAKQIITADRPNTELDHDLQQLRQVLEHGGYVVLYECDSGGLFPTRAELEQRFSLETVFHDGGSCVLRVG